MPFYGAQRGGTDPFVSLADGALSAWFAALSGPPAVIPVVGIGDSLMTGRKATNFAGTSFWQVFIAALKKRYGDAGMGFLSTFCDTTDAGIGGAPSVCDLPASAWSFSVGSWSISAGGPGGRSVKSSTAASTATCTFYGTAFDLWLAIFSGGGPFSYTVDGQAGDANGVLGGAGGNPTSVGTAGPTKVLTVSGLAPGVHTLVVTIIASLVQVAGITVYNGRTAGILPLRFARGGQSVYDTHKNPSFGDCAKGSVEAFTPTPKLVLIQHAINDMQQLNAFALFEDGLRRFYDSAVVAGASVAHLIPYVGPATALSNRAYSHRYIAKIYTLAARYGGVVIDVNQAWEALSPTYVQNNLLAGDGCHPGDLGHADIAQRLLAVLAP